MQAAGKRQKGDEAPLPAAVVAPDLEAPSELDAPPKRSSRIVVSKRSEGVVQMAAVLHAVALECGLQGFHLQDGQVRLLSSVITFCCDEFG